MKIPDNETFIPFGSVDDRKRWERKNCDLCVNKCHVPETITYKQAKEITFICFTYFSEHVKTIKLNDCKAKAINSNPIQE